MQFVSFIKKASFVLRFTTSKSTLFSFYSVFKFTNVKTKITIVLSKQLINKIKIILCIYQSSNLKYNLENKVESQFFDYCSYKFISEGSLLSLIDFQ